MGTTKHHKSRRDAQKRATTIAATQKQADYGAVLLLFGVILCLLLALSHKAYAGTSLDIPSSLKINAAHSAPNLTNHPSILGSTERKSSDLSEFVKWTGMFKRFQKQMGQNAFGPYSEQLIKQVKSSNQRDLYSLASQVNKIMNAKRYITDSQNYGKSDYWATPLEFMQRGGDCEDYAIAKYTALRMLGVPESRLRIAVVQDTLKNIPHAILIVYTNKGPVYLDNQSQSIKSASGGGRYEPFFSINRQGWWLHKKMDTRAVTRINVAAK